ncbi:hypothetical protein [Vibrio diabolicus]|uniref:hypothetical protein n=1 Tax=Vibrio diabolicus TaxID=50719 RepID=UPI002940C059|nr:hypothetical protein [Vibrio diabolicus]MDV5034057.1 hypothetical protein [Vibrio diabolicus]
MMMYPSNLPYPQFPEQGIKQQPNRISSEMSTGRTRDRRRHITAPAEETLVFRMPKDKAAAFLGWVEHALNGGIRWFQLNQRTELGVVPIQIKMKSHPLENAKSKGGRFFYSVKCEIRQYPIQSEAITVGQMLAPHTLEEFVEGADMSRYYTESWKQ